MLPKRALLCYIFFNIEKQRLSVDPVTHLGTQSGSQI